MQANTIDEVIELLNGILEDAIRSGARIGYFAGLYLRVTLSVKRAILAGDVFQDNARMEALDVCFANRFLEAWTAQAGKGRPTAPWAVAFGALESADFMVVQHLGAAMNAHIDLDLGVAAEQVMRERGEPLADLHDDFNMINTVLARLIGVVQVQLMELSPTFRDLERLAPGLQNKVFGRALDGIRDGAWALATKLDEQGSEVKREAVIAERAALSAAAGELVLHPPLVGAFVSRVAGEEAANGVKFNVQVVAE